jgi:hypothetical protein
MASLTRSIPPRPRDALTGSQFAELVSKMSPEQREQAIEEELSGGNLPDFLRKLVPVELDWLSPSGQMIAATIFAAPDYLAIGSDDDFLRIPINFYTAESIVRRWGFVLPTPKMVDAIYAQSAYHLVPQPLAPGPQMTSTEYYRNHNQMIQEQARARGIPLGALVSGDKKDVVITNRLDGREGRIAIYGWHWRAGHPIQPLSTVHGAGYADYSHGVRLVSEMVLIGGRLRTVYDVLRAPTLAKVLSDEGPLRNILSFISPSRNVAGGDGMQANGR